MKVKKLIVDEKEIEIITDLEEPNPDFDNDINLDDTIDLTMVVEEVKNEQ